MRTTSRGTLLLGLMILIHTAALAVDCYEEIDPYYWLFDVPSMIQVDDVNDVTRVRSDVIQYLWTETGWPGDSLPASVTTVWEAGNLGYDCDSTTAPPEVPGLVLWLDAQDLGTLTLSENRVVEWRDKSGYMNDAAQYVSSRQPAYVTDAIGGMSAISFDGDNDNLEIPDDLSLDVVDITAFIVVKVIDPDNVTFPVPLAKMPINDAYLFFLDYADNAPAFRVVVSDEMHHAQDPASVTGEADVWVGWHDDTTVTLFRNGVEVDSSPAPGPIDANAGPLLIGDGVANAFHGYIAEVLIYDQALSATDLERIGTYLGCKYQIPRQPPGWVAAIGSENLARVDRLDIQMDYDLHSYAYHLHPAESVNRLLIFHQGHSNDMTACGADATIGHFLDSGYSFLTFWMPLFGENSTIAYRVPGYGPVTLTSHDHMSQVLENERGSFIRFFIEPVVVGINHVKAAYAYHDVNMIGISGGGWTTHLVAALDMRVGLSFPVAGSLPLYLRSGPCPNGSAGDAEQEWGPLYEDTASWLDLYVLGGYGQEREQVHVLNKYDNVCFYGINYLTYEDYVTAAVENLGAGGYHVHLDTTHADHKISDVVIEDVIGPLIESHQPSGVYAPAEPAENGAPTLSSRSQPNPFRHTATILYTVPPGAGAQTVVLNVHDAEGRLIRRLIHDARLPGVHAVTWDGRNDDGGRMPSGVYTYRLRIAEMRVARRLIRLP